MYCPECGEETPNNARFCVHCRARLADYKTEKPAGATIQDSVVKAEEVVFGNKITQEAPDPSARQQATMTGMICPVCHQVVVGADWFQCPQCGEKYIHKTHQDPNTTWCPRCVLKRRRAMGEIAEGDVLGDRYEIRRLLGEGGMGKVFLGFDRELQREFALKFLPAEIAHSPATLVDLRREAQILVDLAHENLVRLYDLVTVESHRFLKMEFVDGPSLDLMVAKARADQHGLPLETVLAYAKHIGAGLTYLHGNKVIHRDLKPANLMVNSRGIVKIMDFGIATLIRETMSRVSNRPTTGTLVYMSPEQLLGKPLDARSDIYSLGCVLYELLSGRPPFHAGAIFEQHLYAEPQSLAGVPPHVAAAVAQALAKSPEERFAACSDLLAALTTEPRPVPVVAPAPASKPEPPLGPPPAPTQEEQQEFIRFKCDCGRGLRVSARFAGQKGRCPACGKEVSIPRQDSPRTEGPTSAEESIPPPPPTATTPQIITNSIGIKFGLVPAGRFRMGSDKGADDEKPVHEVEISTPFYLGIYPVTQAQYEHMMKANPSEFKGANRPVECVSWENAAKFCEALSRLESWEYRLPTEAEWEYACRAGSTTEYCFGESEAKLPEYAWFRGHSGGKTHDVGQKRPNAWGLFDMHGSVFEWTASEYFDSGWEGTPAVPAMRGGSWNSVPKALRSASRRSEPAGMKFNYVGFRVVRSAFSAAEYLRFHADKGDANAQFDLGHSYFNGEGVPEDKAEAVKWYRMAAEQGHAEAQNTLGVCHFNGEGVVEDRTEAMKWYRLAAEQGNPYAQFNLGLDHFNGECVPEDEEEAVKWYRAAAEQGLAIAQVNLGWCYCNGQGVPEDKAEGVRWYRTAAEGGYAEAQYALGQYYEEGEGVPKDEPEAVKWYRLAAAAGNAPAQDLLKARYEKEEGLPEEKPAAAESCRLAAEKGDVKAQCNVGRCYLAGEGVEEDREEAVKWFRLAAEKGDGQAQWRLGRCYYNGQGVPEDRAEAVKWYRLAAEQGYDRAQNNLGVCYSNGGGVPPNSAEAVKWFRLAAKQGLVIAQFNLGCNYFSGQGVPEDKAEAVKWYRLAAKQGYAHAQNALGDCYFNGEGVPANLAEAVRWYRLAAEQGSACAQFNLGGCYFNGNGVPEDKTEAVRWYRRASIKGDASVHFTLGWCYFNGQGVQEDKAEAVRWYRMAAEKGHAPAQSSLGWCYSNGEGIPPNSAEAVRWCRLAAEQGDPNGQWKLGTFYDQGWGVPKDEAEALRWYRLAAEQGDASAQWSLGVCYSSGKGVPKDKAEAVKWYRLAAEQGHAYAESALGECYETAEGVREDKAEAAKWYRLAVEHGDATAEWRLKRLDAQ